ncbi:MAG: flavodoxin-dependent (E)-4-hydroxy-3-methylbut-2-enyl-diphosphate synthase, partial [Candidatus Aminicenantes bacterium]|nr:flavodoxin-dependent (E)-4-hydroxy-3-methylbut-2-enyl-diphosphate synthase [Candidatus Aminicenantes bacterium]
AGLTEAGTLVPGAVKSAAGLALLLREGLADTIRVSLTAPAEDEVAVAFHLLAGLGLRRRGPTVVSCPTCGRTEVDLRSIAADVERKLAGVRAPLTVAVMGCPVNGPGEAREADIGLAAGRGAGTIFARGKPLRRVPEGRIVRELVKEARLAAAALDRKDHG